MDAISDNAAGFRGARRKPVRPQDVDLRWISAILYKNQAVESIGVAAGVLNTSRRRSD